MVSIGIDPYPNSSKALVVEDVLGHGAVVLVPGDAAGGAGRPCGTGAAGGAGAGGGGRRAGGAGVVVRIPPPGDVGIPCEEWWFNGDLMVINDD